MIKSAGEEVCRHFGECGGCRFQDVDYTTQLVNKQSYLEDLFDKPLGQRLQPIVGSPNIYFYRNKMEFSFSKNNGQLICGLHNSRNKREVVDIKECKIFSEDTPVILDSLRMFFGKQNTSVHNRFRHKGFLRHLVLREAKNTQDFMVDIVTSSESILDKDMLGQILLSLTLKKRISSLIWTINDSLSDAVIPESWQVLYGGEFIEEVVGGLHFRILPYSFFQVNSYILEDFHKTLQSILNLKGHEKILDLFSGLGAISLVLAHLCDFIWAVEVEPHTVENAYINTALNRINNVSFLSGDVRKVLFNNMRLWKNNIDVVIVNPPRSGVSRKIVQRIKEIYPRRIVYSSCNPKSFSHDIAAFTDSYSVELIRPFDFFPHTPHIELLGLLLRK